MRRYAAVPLSVTSEEVRSYKPRAELFDAGLGLLGLPAEQVLHVGDSLRADIAGAQGLGIDAAWVNDHGQEVPGSMAIVAECTDLNDLRPLLTDAGERLGTGPRPVG
ncbi:HAD family hydrolase [Corynebacterium sp. USCH3]|uniref:HAD family hydrolase n=1 Tax=Corynebacterium sp. USCH3 TaxID=3024840 RepID=UPI0030B4CA89